MWCSVHRRVLYNTLYVLACSSMECLSPPLTLSLLELQASTDLVTSPKVAIASALLEIATCPCHPTSLLRMTEIDWLSSCHSAVSSSPKHHLHKKIARNLVPFGALLYTCGIFGWHDLDKMHILLGPIYTKTLCQATMGQVMPMCMHHLFCSKEYLFLSECCQPCFVSKVNYCVILCNLIRVRVRG